MNGRLSFASGDVVVQIVVVVVVLASAQANDQTVNKGTYRYLDLYTQLNKRFSRFCGK
jgi:hypothetical protein